MAYTAGELRWYRLHEDVEPPMDPRDPDPWEGKVYDARRRGDEYLDPPAVGLPHSCDGWVIGGAKEVRALIADLQAALPELEEYEKKVTP